MAYVSSRAVPGAQADATFATAVMAIDSDAYIVGGQALFGFRDSRRVLLRYPSGELSVETPADPNIDSTTALYAAPGGEVVALGSRDSFFGQARRTRHFSDNLEYDTVSALLAQAIAAALRGAELSGGAVDPTVGWAIKLAGYDTDFAQEGYDSTPNPIVVAGVTGGTPSQIYTSAPFRISGIDQVAFASVDGGSYSIGCTEPYTTAR